LSNKQQLYQFQLKGADGDGKPLSGVMNELALCDRRDAWAMAKVHERRLAEREPEKQFKVRAVELEKCGPVLSSYVAGIQVKARQWEIAARLLAASLARHESLEINPDLAAMAIRCVLDLNLDA
jgi:hypothetical protein